MIGIKVFVTALATLLLQSYEIMDELVAVRMLRGDFDSLLAGPGDSSHEARRNDLVDKFVGNITKSGRLLGHL